MKTKFKVFLLLLFVFIYTFLLCYPYIKQINDNPPLYGLIVDFHNNRISYDIIKSNYSQLSDKGYEVKTEDETVTITKNDLVITLELDEGVDKYSEPRVRYYHNVEFIFDTVEYRYYEQGIAITIIYETTIFSRKPVVLHILRELYNDLQANSINESST